MRRGDSSEARTDSNGHEYWIYRRDGHGSQAPAFETPTVSAAPLAPIDVRHQVYTALLNALSLTPAHLAHLQARGLTDTHIDSAGYRSLPRKGRKALATNLVQQFGADICQGVPGMYIREAEGNQWWSLKGQHGILIPVRDAQGRIQALKIRGDRSTSSARYLWLSSRDEGGASPGSPAHIPLWDGDTARVRLTEGELKADVATALSGVLTIGIPGAGVLNPALEALAALQAQTVTLAFDADAATNPNVARALVRAVERLNAEGFTPELELWDGAAGKGIDDLLAAGGQPQLLTGPLGSHYVAGLAQQASPPAPPTAKNTSIPPGPNSPTSAKFNADEELPPDPDGEEAPPAPEEAPAECNDQRLNLTDLGNAERLVRRHGRNLRFCRLWGAWFVWDGKRFSLDETGEVMRRAKETVRHIYAEAAEVEGENAAGVRAAIADWARRSESRDRLSAMISLAETEADIAIRPNELDTDPWLLNVQNGTLDLRTGQLRSHRRADLITRLCPVPYRPEAEAPTWDAFLLQVMGGDAELVAYLRRVAGFCLTGVEPDRVMWFLYGNGRNGKSTFVNQLHDVLADYTRKTRAETLLANPNGDGIPHDLAELKGARLVTSAELTEGRRLNEARIKDLTGRDVIKARFLHQEFFEFRPTFKLFMYGNHKPTVKGTDEGIWDRVKLVPFEVRITEEQKDERLPEKLRAEAAGILAWMVRGCLEWQEHGLQHPEKVRAATQAYRAEMDTLAPFLEDCCIVEPLATTTAKALYQTYRSWCEANGEHALSQKALGGKLAEKGLEPYRKHGGVRWWRGVGLLSEAVEAGGTSPSIGLSENSAPDNASPEPAAVTHLEAGFVPDGDAVTQGDTKSGVFPALFPHEAKTSEIASLSVTRHRNGTKPEDEEPYEEVLL